jgi:hypothetical protein
MVDGLARASRFDSSLYFSLINPAIDHQWFLSETLFNDKLV